ncbi:SusC/RagA family TonB-linked outer membrane protein [Fulvivirgaceae bacterium PWU4]|uniref:SusC/RagA family TonB-linked outer membrane protein n=1 Tax=Chryseosolibacter histidini TaxID=2782349 RepID=A0AAP2DKD6_9BACT|nr:SusC/RagA family TonB-linked outer membrane protein [Chryseosolibacter histidini]MBT1697920.1 SusC/RagA family TonB-linked outer membrane protein [Chryseosolibacter histidini]
MMLSMILEGNAQNTTKGGIHTIEVTVELNDESLESCFKSIERQTGLLFAFLPGQVDPYTSITLPKATRTVSATLDLVLKHTSLTYRQMNNSIVIFEKPTPSRSETTDAKEEMAVPALHVVTGKVTGPDGEPVPEANVQIKGAHAVTTDLDGRYTAEVLDHDVLVFSFVGYKTVETNVNSRKVIDLAMEYEVPLLQEVEVNAGYWKVKGREQTGNISKVTAKEIENQPVSNPLVALEGRVPGVYIHQYSGVPGGGVSIQIRGTNSLREYANDPLYIIDGVPFPSTQVSSSFISGAIIPNANPLNNINIADIESIEILKDADATAIYGSRGANGVVLVTTKAGRKASGSMQVNVDFRQGVGRITRTMDLLNTQQWLEMRKEAFRNDGVTMTANNAPDLLRWDTTRYTDWQKVLLGGTARVSDVKASVSGGDEFTRYLFSTNYYRESTVFPGDFSFRKGSAHFNFNHATRNDGFRFSLLASYTGTGNNLPKTDPIGAAIQLAPVAPRVYDDQGELNWENGTWANPFGALRQTYTSNIGTVVVNSIISYRVLPGLYMNNNLGYTNVQVDELQKNPISSLNPTAPDRTGSSMFGDNKVNTWIAEPQLEYRDTIGAHGVLKMLVGTTFQQTISKGQTLWAKGYRNDDLLEDPLSAPEIEVAENAYAQYRYNAIFGRINFNWKEKYIINLTGRRDGSSRFGPGKQFANFGAIGTAWIFSSEPFIEHVFPFLSYGKLRASHGITGSDQIGDYQYLDSYSSTSNTYNGLKGTVPIRLYNPDYSWESNKKTEAAIELGFAGNRILLSTSYYHNLSSNQLVGHSLPVITGQASINSNLGAVVQNTGVEVMLNTVNVFNSNFTWKTYINATAPQNKLINYPNLKGSDYDQRYVVGQPLSIRQKYHYTGVNPETGIYTFEDVDGDGNMSAPNDYQSLKKVTQQFYGGIQNNIRYKNWQLDVFFQFVKQTGINYLSMFLNTPGSRLTNQPVQVLDRWQQPGDITGIQQFTQRGGGPLGVAATAYNNAREYSDYAISDASFVRLKNVSLSWQLRSSWLKSMRLQQGSVYVQGQNLLTFTKYAGYDPEIPVGSRSLPPLRIVMAGIQLTF